MNITDRTDRCAPLCKADVIAAFGLFQKNFLEASFCGSFSSTAHTTTVFATQIPVVCSNPAGIDQTKSPSVNGLFVWYTRRDSNTRPLAPQANALSS